MKCLIKSLLVRNVEEFSVKRKWVVTHEGIEKNIDWTDQMFDRQPVTKKNRKVDLSKLKKESCANQRELAAQSKINEENTKQIDVLEKLLSAEESST